MARDSRQEGSQVTTPADRMHDAWHGQTVDHLYADCGSIRKANPPAKPCTAQVDPLGGDICGNCLRRWKKAAAGDTTKARADAIDDRIARLERTVTELVRENGAVASAAKYIAAIPIPAIWAQTDAGDPWQPTPGRMTTDDHGHLVFEPLPHDPRVPFAAVWLRLYSDGSTQWTAANEDAVVLDDEAIHPLSPHD